MNFKINICILIAIVAVVRSASDDKLTTTATNHKLETTTVKLLDSSSSLSKKDTKEKRQLDGHQTAINPQQQQHHHSHYHPQAATDTIYSSASQPSHFVVRAVGYNNNGNRRPHQLHQQFIQQPQQLREQSQIQSEQTQEAAQQQYTYLAEPPQHRALQPTHSKSGPHKKTQSVRPVQFVQEIPRYSPHPYPLIPEDQLLKLLEEELTIKGITNLQQRPQVEPKQQQHIHIVQSRKPAHQQQHQQQQQQQQQVAETNVKQGLGNYRQQPEQPDHVEYIYLPQAQALVQQQQQQQHLQDSVPLQYYAPQHLQKSRPIYQQVSPSQQTLYPAQAAQLDYHRNIPNHPLAASSLEKEIEKLFASNKPNHNYEQPQVRYAIQPQPQPQPQSYKASKHLSKSYGTTPAPTEKEYSFLPSLAEFSGFKQPQQQIEPTQQETSEQSARQYLPKVYQTRTQYLQETSPTKQRRPKPQLHQNPYQQQTKSQPAYPQYYTPVPPPQQQTHNQQQSAQSQFVPIANPNQAKNAAMKVIDAPALQYQKPRTVPAATHIYYNDDQPVALPQTASQQPSQSSIYVAQGTGIHNPTPQTSQLKAYGRDNKNGLRLPPPNGKPISQEEFQALVDAGYPVQAVPVPVPVPYEKYIKDHPEYKYQQQQHQQQQQQQQQQEAAESNQYNSRSGITYLRPIRGQPVDEENDPEDKTSQRN